ncbi:MAG: 50S ribosomal protein L23 [Candidatus Limnocylindrales bacterium]
MSLTAQDIVIHPVISEKSMDEAQHGKYTFAVHEDANKLQIAAAIEELFKVQVLGVNVLTTKAKVKRSRSGRSRKGGLSTPWRKATVTLAPGQKIEFFEAV